MADVKIRLMSPEDLIPYENNPRYNDEAVEAVMQSIRDFGFKNPVIVDKKNVIIAGHTRIKAAIRLGLEKVPVIRADDLTEEQAKAYRLVDNKTGELATWDLELLDLELTSTSWDMTPYGFEITDTFYDLDPPELVDIEPEEVPEEPETKAGDMYKLGNHVLLCGDSTKEEDVKKLERRMGKGTLTFTDPPYGMKKEIDGVINDNLNYDDLLEFNKKWIPLSFDILTDVGSWYCWGIDEPLMDIYSEILKPMIKSSKATFRNLITWDKGDTRGMSSSVFRSYPRADEKCLFIMKGVQGLNINADNYYEGWEPIRSYLDEEMKKCGGSKNWEKALGNQMGKHYFTKSQWLFPTEENYKKLQDFAKGDAFKKEYDVLKKEFLSTRAYFDNSHDTMTNVWTFGRTSGKEREETGGHATPKPIELCARAIKSSSQVGDVIYDFFGGSGSTLVTAEQLGRKCAMMELDPGYCDVIIRRWEKLTGLQAEKINDR